MFVCFCFFVVLFCLFYHCTITFNRKPWIHNSKTNDYYSALLAGVSFLSFQSMPFIFMWLPLCNRGAVRFCSSVYTHTTHTAALLHHPFLRPLPCPPSDLVFVGFCLNICALVVCILFSNVSFTHDWFVLRQPAAKSSERMDNMVEGRNAALGPAEPKHWPTSEYSEKSLPSRTQLDHH